ncbi:tetratricopeptide repeat protein [Pseudoroseomonas cervicalis]|nr:tetratricopeptide repeat protein [Pseudoroseomonas cervicalis]WBV44646.1 tetratricopeptide repeat protein [Pseudoroseomonas cervicalis]
MRQGAARHRQGALAEAAALYRQVLALAPEQPDALNLLGTVLRQQGDLEGALALIRRALARQPQAPVYLASLGAALAEAGRLEEAVAALRGALQRRPRDGLSLRHLGQALAALGRAREALPPLRQAVKLAPDSPEARLALAHAAREAGATPESRREAEAALRLAGQDAGLAGQARFLLAALGAAAAPERAPAAYVRDLFDQYAPRFDADLTQRLAYRTPQALAALLAAQGGPAEGQLDILDLGCGTGLSGLALAPFARRLEGLDLSPRMLAEAARTGCYAALHEADLLDFLPRHPAAYDLVAAADVLNYLGDLAPALAAIAAALRPGGRALFSVETGEASPYALGEGLRYRHALPHLRGLCAAAGLALRAEQPSVLRQERGQDVAGALLLLQRAG